MRPQFGTLFVWSLGLFIFFMNLSCTREVDDRARLLFQAPQSNSSLSGDNQLIHLEVRIVNASNSQTLASYSYDVEDDSQAPALIELKVASGDGRLIQVLAIYENSTTEQVDFKYGDALRNLSSGDNIIDISLQKIGTGTGEEGILAGRFLTSANVGPTGTVKAYYHPPGRPRMEVIRSEIFGGWFRFFMIDGVEFQWETASGIEIFHRASATAPALQNRPSLIQVKSPLRYSNFGNGLETLDPETFYFGFFGPGAEGKLVCYNPANNVTVSNSFKDSGLTQAVEWFASGGTVQDVRRVSGGSSSADPICQDSAQKYVNFIEVQEQKFADRADGVLGFDGPFRALPGGGSHFLDVSKSSGQVTLSWDYLPQVFSGVGALSGVEVFQAARPDINADLLFKDRDKIRCELLEANGYESEGVLIGAAVTSVTFPDNNIQLATSSGDSSPPNYVLCPFRAGIPKTYFRTVLRSHGSGGCQGNCGPNLKLVFSELGQTTEMNRTLDFNICRGIQLNVLDNDGNPSPLTENIQFEIRADGDFGGENLGLFSDSGCTSGVTQLDITSTNSSAQFYLKTTPTKAGYGNLRAYPNTPSSIQTAHLDIGVVTAAAPAETQLTVFSSHLNSTALLAEGQCYQLEARLGRDDSGRRVPAKSASATSLTAILDQGNGSNTVTGNFYPNTDCEGAVNNNFSIPANSYQVGLSFKPNGLGFVTALPWIKADDGGGLTEIAQEIKVGPGVAYQVSARNERMTLRVQGSRCERVEFRPVNTVGADIQNSTDLNFDVTTITNGVTLHEQGDCSDGPMGLGGIVISAESQGFKELFMKTPAGEYETSITTELNSIPSVQKFIVQNWSQTPLANAFSNYNGLTQTLTASGFSNPFDLDFNRPSEADIMTVDVSLAASPSPSIPTALIWRMNKIDMSSTGRTVSANGKDGVVNGGDGGSGGGGGGGEFTAAGGNGGSNGAPGGSGTGSASGAAGASSSISYMNGFNSGSFPSFPIGGTGGMASGGAVSGGGGGYGTGGGGAGGNGGGSTSESGGGGGGGGGLVLMVANEIIGPSSGSSRIEAKGGDGGLIVGDGGAGGGGGSIYIAARKFNGTNLVCDVRGGAGDIAGTGGLEDGDPGSNGNFSIFKILDDGSLQDKTGTCICDGVSMMACSW